jgi:hypothetical protein
MQKRTRGRPKLAKRSTTPQQLDAMLRARQQMTQCIDRFDTLLYNRNDRGLTERTLDQLVLKTITTLQEFYVSRTGLDADVP